MSDLWQTGFPIALRWHRWRGHEFDARRVSVPMFDLSWGWLIDCSCGKRWAR